MIADDRGPKCVGVISARKPRDRIPLKEWKEAHNASHWRACARVEHVFARMKNWRILRDCRRRDAGIAHAAHGIAFMHNLSDLVERWGGSSGLHHIHGEFARVPSSSPADGAG